MRKAKNKTNSVGILWFTQLEPTRLFSHSATFDKKESAIGPYVRDTDDSLIKSLNKLILLSRDLNFNLSAFFGNCVSWYIDRVKNKSFSLEKDLEIFKQERSKRGSGSISELYPFHPTKKVEAKLKKFLQSFPYERISTKVIRISIIRYAESLDTVSFRKQFQKTKKELNKLEKFILNPKG